MHFTGGVAAYDPKTGKQLWLNKLAGENVFATPVAGEGTLVAMSGGMGGGSAAALKLSAEASSGEPESLWHVDRVKSHTGSGVLFNEHLYAVSENGIAECFDLKTGSIVWQERLRGSGSQNSSWSSLILSGDKLYVPNQGGDVFVFRAGPKFELLATNSVGEQTNASLAASDGDILLRSEKSLWCFGKAR
jgi:hypothetical protein